MTKVKPWPKLPTLEEILAIPDMPPLEDLALRAD